MTLLRSLQRWRRLRSERRAASEEQPSAVKTQSRPRIHRKMVPLVRYLEQIGNRTADLTFRYVGPNQMNGDAEEIQVFIAVMDQQRSLTIRYLDRLELYLVSGPRDQKLDLKSARDVLDSLSVMLADVFPQESYRKPPAGRS